MFARYHRCVHRRFLCLILIIVGLLLAGCGADVSEFFEKKYIEVQSRDLIRELSAPPVIPDINNSMPEIYHNPPEIVIGQKDTKVFYFAKHLPPSELARLINDQLEYKTSLSPAMNQLIIKCADPCEAALAIDFLEKVDLAPVQIRIDCLISELFADATMDWETTLEIDDLFGSGDSGLRRVGDAITDALSLTGPTGNPAFPGASVRSQGRSSAGLQVGLQSASGSFRATVDILSSKGYLKIIMNPTLRTVNGKKATITTTDEVPVIEFVQVTDLGETVSVTKYKKVVDSLEVTPQIYADGSIGLTTKVKIGSKSTPEGVTQNTIITSREIIVEENRIRPGESLIIGGIRKSEQLGIVRGSPGLQDLPILGMLFSSKDVEDRVKEILFILTPSISDSGTPYRQVKDEIAKKHKKPEIKKSFSEKLVDPFGDSAYTEHIEQKMIATEQEVIHKIAVQQQMRQEYEKRMQRAYEEAIQAKSETQKAIAQKAQAIAATAEAEKAMQKAEAAAAAAEAEAEKAMQKAEAEKARQKAEAERAEEAVQPQ